MVTIDAIKDYFVRRVLMPEVFKINVPGYVTGKFYTLEGQTVFVRNVFIPETFFTELEDVIITTKQKEGEQELYALGKQFGHRFSSMNKFPRIDLNQAAS